MLGIDYVTIDYVAIW